MNATVETTRSRPAKLVGALGLLAVGLWVGVRPWLGGPNDGGGGGGDDEPFFVVDPDPFVDDVLDEAGALDETTVPKVDLLARFGSRPNGLDADIRNPFVVARAAAPLGETSSGAAAQAAETAGEPSAPPSMRVTVVLSARGADGIVGGLRRAVVDGRVVTTGDRVVAGTIDAIGRDHVVVVDGHGRRLRYAIGQDHADGYVPSAAEEMRDGAVDEPSATSSPEERR